MGTQNKVGGTDRLAISINITMYKV